MQHNSLCTLPKKRVRSGKPWARAHSRTDTIRSWSGWNTGHIKREGGGNVSEGWRSKAAVTSSGLGATLQQVLHPSRLPQTLQGPGSSSYLGQPCP